MKSDTTKTMIATAIVLALGVSACEVKTPAGAPGPAGATGASGAPGASGAAGATGATGKPANSTIVVVPPANAERH